MKTLTYLPLVLRSLRDINQRSRRREHSGHQTCTPVHAQPRLNDLECRVARTKWNQRLPWNRHVESNRPGWMQKADYERVHWEKAGTAYASATKQILPYWVCGPDSIPASSQLTLSGAAICLPHCTVLGLSNPSIDMRVRLCLLITISSSSYGLPSR